MLILPHDEHKGYTIHARESTSTVLAYVPITRPRPILPDRRQVACVIRSVSQADSRYGPR